MTDRKFYTYVIFDMDGTPRYVGKGTGDRWREKNRAHNPRLQALFKRCDPPVIKVCEDLTEREAFDAEIAFIAAIGRGAYGPLFNFTEGGEGCTLDECTKIRRRRKRAGKKHDEFNAHRWDAARLMKPDDKIVAAIRSQMAGIKSSERLAYLNSMALKADSIASASAAIGIRAAVLEAARADNLTQAFQ